MKLLRKEQIICNVQEVIDLTVGKAKSEHRRYLRAIRDDDLSRQISISSTRDCLLETARRVKNAMLPCDLKIRDYGYLHKVQNRRWEREYDE